MKETRICFVCYFNDAVTSSDYIASNDGITEQ
jgi:hypothetical protein